ncbi:MAG: SMC-Scp complex subunit ScpB [Clostridiales bacterium]|nr:SMC-Scp complex subunit ScpB [Clostridiales bacterium]
MENLSKLIEGILFVSGEPVSFMDIAEKLELTKEEVESAVLELQKYKADNNDGVQVLVFNEKAQLCSNKEYAENISIVLNPLREKMLTKVVLEVCGIIAYKQPITRTEVESIRGGASCDYAINMLLENNLIEVVGRKDAVGKPLLFGTTDNFLKKFNISSLEDLPDYNHLLERIKVLHEDNDNSLFDFREIPPEEEDIAKDMSEEEQDEIVKSIKESREEIIEDRNKLDDILDQFVTDLHNIPDIDLNFNE